MSKIIVSEKKFVFIIGIISTIFSAIIGVVMLLALLATDIGMAVLCFLLFSFFLALGIYLILMYCNHKLIIDKTYCEYVNWRGHRKQFNIKEIELCEVLFSKSFISCTSYNLFDHDKNHLASFKSNMKNVDQVFDYLPEPDVTYVNRMDTEIVAAVSSATVELKEKEVRKLEKHMEKSKFIKIKKGVRFLSYAHSFVLLIVFFTLPSKWVFLAFAITPVLYYFIYLRLYPRMVCDIRKGETAKWKNSHIKVPFLPILFSIIILLINASTMNLRNESKFFVLVFLFSLILFIPFVFTSKHREERIRKGKWILVYLAMLAYSFSSMFAWNYILRVKAFVHETTSIVDKESYRSRNGRDYSIEVYRFNGEKTWLSVSRNVYNSSSIKSNVKLCKRVSIFGIEYWYVHM